MADVAALTTSLTALEASGLHTLLQSTSSTGDHVSAALTSVRAPLTQLASQLGTAVAQLSGSDDVTAALSFVGYIRGNLEALGRSLDAGQGVSAGVAALAIPVPSTLTTLTSATGALPLNLSSLDGLLATIDSTVAAAKYNVSSQATDEWRTWLQRSLAGLGGLAVTANATFWRVRPVSLDLAGKVVDTGAFARGVANAVCSDVLKSAVDATRQAQSLLQVARDANGTVARAAGVLDVLSSLRLGLQASLDAVTRGVDGALADAVVAFNGTWSTLAQRGVKDLTGAVSRLHNVVGSVVVGLETKVLSMLTEASKLARAFVSSVQAFVGRFVNQLASSPLVSDLVDLLLDANDFIMSFVDDLSPIVDVGRSISRALELLPSTGPVVKIIRTGIETVQSVRAVPALPYCGLYRSPAVSRGLPQPSTLPLLRCPCRSLARFSVPLQ